MRKTSHFPITTEGRDKGKLFLITEMAATRAEKWAIRALFALGKAGIVIPENAMAGGMESLVSLGYSVLTNMPFGEAEPLLDEMMGCVQICPDSRNTAIVRGINEDDIEEIATRIRLRLEVFRLHTGFTQAVEPSGSPLVPAA